MNILFYTPFNSRSRDTESVMEAFVRQGHNVFLLTQAELGPYHERCKKLGVDVYAKAYIKKNPFIYFLRHTLFLFRFCNCHNVDLVYAHLETASLPAVLIERFIHARVVACRHIIDEAYLLKSRNFILLNKIVYRIARHIVVVSEHAREFMISHEKIDPSKITVIPLAYNFALYDAVNHEEVAAIRKRYGKGLLIMTASRLIGPKRPELTISLAKILANKNVEATILLLGEGPNRGQLEKEVVDAGLTGRVYVLGYKRNVMDYLAACDLLFHPSLLDSSSVIIKEAGLQEKPVIACKEIGDVSDYLTNGVDAFLVPAATATEEAAAIIATYALKPDALAEIGRSLGKVVRHRFSIDEVIHQYERYHLLLKLA